MAESNTAAFRSVCFGYCARKTFAYLEKISLNNAYMFCFCFIWAPSELTTCIPFETIHRVAFGSLVARGQVHIIVENNYRHIRPMLSVTSIFFNLDFDLLVVEP